VVVGPSHDGVLTKISVEGELAQTVAQELVHGGGGEKGDEIALVEPFGAGLELMY
jgi:hypothetical protein